MAQRYLLTADGLTSEVGVRPLPGGLYEVEVGDQRHQVELKRIGNTDLYSVLIDHTSVEVYASRRPGGYDVLVGNRVYEVRTGPAVRRPAAEEPAEGPWTLHAPMSGIVAEVSVEVGEPVAQGQVLVVVESMKMNNELRSRRDGVVAGVHAALGQRVDTDQPLITVADAEAGRG